MKIAQRIFFLIGFLSAGVAAFSFFASQGYPDWIETEGYLHSVSLQNASSPTVAGASDWGANIGRAQYRYRAGGIEYTGSRIMPLQHVYLSSSVVTKLQPGEIPIFYNPREPSSSFIYAITPYTQIMLLMLAALSAFGMSVLLPNLLRAFIGALHGST